MTLSLLIFVTTENHDNFVIIFFSDAPTIRLLGAPQIDLEEGKDSLILRCEADANPPASIVWRRAGRSEIASLQVNNSTPIKKKKNLKRNRNKKS